MNRAQRDRFSEQWMAANRDENERLRQETPEEVIRARRRKGASRARKRRFQGGGSDEAKG